MKPPVKVILASLAAAPLAFIAAVPVTLVLSLFVIGLTDVDSNESFILPLLGIATITLSLGTGALWVNLSPSWRPWQRVATILMSMTALVLIIGLPQLDDGRHGNAKRNSCIANLRQIEGAKQQWAIENRKQYDNVPTDAELFGPAGYIDPKPLCPTHGQYQLGRVAQSATCTIDGHQL